MSRGFWNAFNINSCFKASTLDNDNNFWKIQVLQVSLTSHQSWSIVHLSFESFGKPCLSVFYYIFVCNIYFQSLSINFPEHYINNKVKFSTTKIHIWGVHVYTSWILPSVEPRSVFLVLQREDEENRPSVHTVQLDRLWLATIIKS